MPSKHDYSGRAPNNMQPERRGTPRNAASPPPDAPVQPFSQPPRTQAYADGRTANSPPAAAAAKQGGSSSPQSQGAQGGRNYGTQYQAQPSRAGRHDNSMASKQGMGPDMRPGGGGGRKPPLGPEKPTGTAVPERRGMKEAGRAETDPGAFNITSPSATPGDGRGAGFQRSGHDSSRNRK